MDRIVVEMAYALDAICIVSAKYDETYAFIVEVVWLVEGGINNVGCQWA